MAYKGLLVASGKSPVASCMCLCFLSRPWMMKDHLWLTGDHCRLTVDRPWLWAIVLGCPVSPVVSNCSLRLLASFGSG